MNKSIKRIEMDNQQAKRTERHLKKQKNICVLAEINLSDSMSRLLVYAKDPHNPTVGVLRLVNSNTNQSEWYMGQNFKSIARAYQIPALDSTLLKRVYHKALRDSSYWGKLQKEGPVQYNRKASLSGSSSSTVC